ncbi:MAG TPA: DNA recombination protein RmuC [Thermoanaerobaculia bacterium]|nr:DNA recombination protein RmuC [Thermoanaerobaculia bacterium]
MSSPVIALLIASVAAAAVLAAAFALLSRSKEAASRLDRLLADSAAARGTSESIDRRFGELRRSVEERVSGVEQRLVDGQKNLADHLGASGRLLQDVGQRMGQIYEASQKIEKLAGDVTRLEDLLKPPKLRGALGEAFLEQTLRQVLPAQGFQMQYRFPDNVVVDAAIFVGERIVPVDSKFPLENFRRAREAPEEPDRRRAQREFASDVRKHVEAIRTRYIRPESGTFDFALMYVPAEAIYCEIVGEEAEGQGLADYAMERRVFPVSPRLLYAYLATVALGMRGLELQRSALEIQERLSDLTRLWDRVQDPFQKVRTHLSNTQKQFDEADKALGRFGDKLSGIAEVAEEKLEKREEVASPQLSVFATPDP